MRTLHPALTRASVLPADGRWADCRGIALRYQLWDVMRRVQFEFANPARFGRARIVQQLTWRVNG
jgi:hypothetical protein